MSAEITSPARMNTLRNAIALSLLATLSACAAVPSSGPTGAQIRSQIEADNAGLPVALVQLQAIADLPVSRRPAPVFADDFTPPPPTALVGPGDVLDITVYETGIALFGGAGGSAAPIASVPGASSGMDPAARGERFPPFRVSDVGTINFPYLGEVAVGGRTVDQVSEMLRRALRRKSQNPQVLVSIAQGLTNSVIIGGDVRQPGRLVLPTNRESLSDVIALAGGNTGEMKDMLVRVLRDGTYGEFRLSEIMSQPEQDIRVFPADRILLVRSPQSFSVLGAAGRADQITFPGASLSLAEAVAMSGGANPNAGDPRAIFVFRFVKGTEGEDIPTVYHLNMMEARSYILAQRFTMKDKDVLYIGNAEANQPNKLVQIVSQLFFPLATFQGVINSNN